MLRRRFPAATESALAAICGILVFWSAWAGPPSVTAPQISSVIKPKLQKRLFEEREILTSATLEDQDASSARRYHFYSAMLVRSSVKHARAILTDYAIYAKMVPYVEKAEYTAASRILEIAGGVFGFRLHSSVRFEEEGENWIRYRVVAGHFTGLSGDIVFESLGERGTVVMMRGELLGTAWPPKFVIERGAEIVFGFTAKRMRSYIESQKQPEARPDQDFGHNSEQNRKRSPEQGPRKGPNQGPNQSNDKSENKNDHGDREVPQPRSHL